MKTRLALDIGGGQLKQTERREDVTVFMRGNGGGSLSLIIHLQVVGAHYIGTVRISWLITGNIGSIGNGNGNCSAHSQILGSGMGFRNSTPNFWERVQK